MSGGSTNSSGEVVDGFESNIFRHSESSAFDSPLGLNPVLLSHSSLQAACLGSIPNARNNHQTEPSILLTHSESHPIHSSWRLRPLGLGMSEWKLTHFRLIYIMPNPAK